jgi:hypothetical protein
MQMGSIANSGFQNITFGFVDALPVYATVSTGFVIGNPNSVALTSSSFQAFQNYLNSLVN